MTLSFFIDENLSPVLADPITRVYRRGARLITSQQAQLGGWPDLDLFPELAAHAVAVIITKDDQLEDHAERDGLHHAGLHWLGVPELSCRGTELLAHQLAVVTPAIHYALEHRTRQPTAFTLALPPRSPFATVTAL